MEDAGGLLDDLDERLPEIVVRGALAFEWGDLEEIAVQAGRRRGEFDRHRLRSAVFSGGGERFCPDESTVFLDGQNRAPSLSEEACWSKSDDHLRADRRPDQDAPRDRHSHQLLIFLLLGRADSDREDGGLPPSQPLKHLAKIARRVAAAITDQDDGRERSADHLTNPLLQRPCEVRRRPLGPQLSDRGERSNRAREGILPHLEFLPESLSQRLVWSKQPLDALDSRFGSPLLSCLRQAHAQ